MEMELERAVAFISLDNKSSAAFFSYGLGRKGTQGSHVSSELHRNYFNHPQNKRVSIMIRAKHRLV